jgi:hypothetical protein
LVRHVSLRHLVTLSGEHGIFEHARGSQPDYEHGYCTDDNARLLIVAARTATPSMTSKKLESLALKFVSKAVTTSGRVYNRMNHHGQWTDEPSTDDCWGRLVWATGVAVAEAESESVRQRALSCFECAIQQKSNWLRSQSFAALGAAEVLRTFPQHEVALEFLRDFAEHVPDISTDSDWIWPEQRLSYANAVIPEALIASGYATANHSALGTGLTMLDWLIAHETTGDRLSLTPTNGSGAGERKPGFDQQPIEAAAIAEACAHAYRITHDPVWGRGLKHSILWFLGHNDSNQIMIDPISGGGFDGLTRTGVNRNQGAESTLAMIATLQHLAERRTGAKN